MKLSIRHGWARVGPPRTAIGAIAALAGSAIVAAVLVLPLGLAMAQSDIVNPPNPFQPFKTDTGVVLTVKGPNCTHPDNGSEPAPGSTVGADICTTANPFMTPNFGTNQGNGQDCETCHQPQLAWSITPKFLQDRFNDTQGKAVQFRVNDTVTDPRICGAPTTTTTPAQNAANVNACVQSMSLSQKRQAFDLFNDLSIHRIAIKDNPALDDFTITAPTTHEFGVLPIPAGQDSQQPCSVQVPAGTTGTCVQTVSVFRRPLLTVNTFFSSSILWDGRQNVCVEPTPAPGLCPSALGPGPITQPIRTPLLVAQVSGAAQTLPLSSQPTLDQEKMAAHFMTGLFTAMIRDNEAGSLTTNGATGGPQLLADMAAGKVTPPCTPLSEASKANSGAGLPPAPAPGPNCDATSHGFNTFIAFLPKSLRAGASTPAGIQAIFAFCASDDRNEMLNNHDENNNDSNEGKLAIACGENIFTNRPINDPAVGRCDPHATPTPCTPPSGSFGSTAPPNARCTSCHAALDVGANPLPAFLLSYTPSGGLAQKPDLFVGGKTLAAEDKFCAIPANANDPFCKTQAFNLPEFRDRTERLPLYTLTANSGGASIQLTDPGQALITHSFANAGAQKMPALRALAPRGPFFHNGAAQTLDDLVDFYNQNFSIQLTHREHNDLVAFLNAI